MDSLAKLLQLAPQQTKEQYMLTAPPKVPQKQTALPVNLQHLAGTKDWGTVGLGMPVGKGFLSGQVNADRWKGLTGGGLNYSMTF